MFTHWQERSPLDSVELARPWSTLWRRRPGKCHSGGRQCHYHVCPLSVCRLSSVHLLSMIYRLLSHFLFIYSLSLLLCRWLDYSELVNAQRSIFSFPVPCLAHMTPSPPTATVSSQLASLGVLALDFCLLDRRWCRFAPSARERERDRRHCWRPVASHFSSVICSLSLSPSFPPEGPLFPRSPADWLARLSTGTVLSALSNQFFLSFLPTPLPGKLQSIARRTDQLIFTFPQQPSDAT